MRLSAEDLQNIENILVSDRVTVRGPEIIGIANLITRVSQAKVFAIEEAKIPQDAPASPSRVRVVGKHVED